MNRRDFLKAVGVATGGAVVSGCEPKKGTHKAVSPVYAPPEGVIPGEPIYIRTTCTECPAGCGVTAEVVDGIPIKLEGTQGHPINDGALCIRGQSSLTRMYNPRRIQHPIRRDGKTWKKITWDNAYEQITRDLRNSQGRQNAYLSGHTTGSLSSLISTFCEQTNTFRAPEYEVYSYANLRAANQAVFGQSTLPLYRIDQADLLITIGADILQTFVSPVHNQKLLTRGKENGLRWVHIEPHASLEGMQADERLPVRPGSEALLVAYLLGGFGVGSPAPMIGEVERATGLTAVAIKQLAADLRTAGAPLAIAGGVSISGENGLRTAILMARLQQSAGMAPRLDFAGGRNVSELGTLDDVLQLAARLSNERVNVLFISRANPVAGAPEEVAFGQSMEKARLRVGLGDVLDETMEKCDLVLPLTHPYESFGDLQQYRGTVQIYQPIIEEKLHNTRTEGDILLDLVRELTGTELAPDYLTYARNRVNAAAGQAGTNLETALGAQALISGVSRPDPAIVSDDGVPVASARQQRFTQAASAAMAAPFAPSADDEPVLILAPSLRFYDGRGKHLKILNEIPDPLSTVTYGPYVSVSEEDAGRMGLRDGDHLQVKASNWEAELPAKIQPRLPRGVYMVDRGSIPALPTGRTSGIGETGAVVTGVSVTATGGATALPVLSGSPSQYGRGIIPEPLHVRPTFSPVPGEIGHPEGADAEHVEPHPGDVEHGQGEHGGETEHHIVTLYPEHPHEGYRWAMAIDLDKCTGCSACVAACHIENNVPLVGKEEHLKGREMSWIRIEPFYEEESTKASMIPMLCQQCDNAPCEAVCPVFATYHNPEGLNAQIYNRCVGTRYCSNNCPYKVRRFNWFDHRPRKDPDMRTPGADFTNTHELPLDWVANPLVSTRTRGVMEKCTFCVQRIRERRDLAQDENRTIRDGEVVPACAQTCPSEAIIFGSKMDKDTAVSKLLDENDYHRVFEELGTEPAVHYLNDTRPQGGEA